jgi:hypothetical protein
MLSITFFQALKSGVRAFTERWDFAVAKCGLPAVCRKKCKLRAFLLNYLLFSFLGRPDKWLSKKIRF